MVKKTISEAVLAANGKNARSSTGPKSLQAKANSSQNATTHGILSRKIHLDTEEKKAEYQAQLNLWRSDFRPVGILQASLVEEIANCYWKLGIVEALETQELSRREDGSCAIEGIFCGDLSLPIDETDLPLDRGWDCERVEVRAVAANDQPNPNGGFGRGLTPSPASGNRLGRDASHLEVQAVLRSSLDTLARYRASLKRDLYRAIEALRKIQAEESDSR